jgi:ADP-ribose pyrophosphatase
MSKIEQSNLYHGRILDLARETHRLPDGRQAHFEIVQHPGGAAALPVLEDGRLLLIRQFRPAAEAFVYEIPAGRLEPGEDPQACVARELEEEVGRRPAELQSLGYVYSSVGFCNEKIHLFVATQLEEVATAHEADEYIEPCILELDAALKLVEADEIMDAKTQIALLRYALAQGRKSC